MSINPSEIEVRRSFAAATLIAIVCAASVGAAQPRARSPADQAREQYERGVVAYNLEHFDEAIAAFSRAYELDPAPILLYNIAQARWKKGENDRALFYYRRYLEADPAAPNRAAVEARIEELERTRQPSSSVPPPPIAPAAIVPPPSPAPPVYLQSAPPPPRPPLYRRPWFWGGVATVAAATTVTVLLLSSHSSPARCNAACNLGMFMVPP
jgi:tetratricopeptide (TPR) repeat protein